jgi:hypothetical protein
MAIGIGIGFLLVVEGLITIVAPDAGPYLPGGTLNTLAAGGNDQLAWGAALGLVVLYGVVAATVSLAGVPHPRHRLLAEPRPEPSLQFCNATRPCLAEACRCEKRPKRLAHSG